MFPMPELPLMKFVLPVVSLCLILAGFLFFLVYGSGMHRSTRPPILIVSVAIGSATASVVLSFAFIAARHYVAVPPRVGAFFFVVLGLPLSWIVSQALLNRLSGRREVCTGAEGRRLLATPAGRRMVRGFLLTMLVFVLFAWTLVPWLKSILVSPHLVLLSYAGVLFLVHVVMKKTGFLR